METLISHETRSISVNDRVEVVCGHIYGSWGGTIDAFSETGIELTSSFRKISEKSMEEIINQINMYNPIRVIEHNREGQNSQLVIFVPWIVIEKIKSMKVD